MDRFQPIFVIGSPRSGTTMIGELIGSHPDVAYFGEFFAFYFTKLIARRTLGRIPSSTRDAYLDSLEVHAREFAERAVSQTGRKFFCDSTPWNALICDDLAREFPKAVFVVTVRRYAGVIQSLRRSSQDGYQMTVDDDAARARLWADCYAAVLRLPNDLCIYLNYDALCEAPEPEIARFLSQVEERTGLATSNFQLSTLAVSHATAKEHPRETIAFRAESGELTFRQKATLDPATWGEEDEDRVRQIVRPVADKLGLRS